jgi:hypothetical protein
MGTLSELHLYDNHKPAPVTLPSLRLPPIDQKLDAEKLIERRTIRLGLDAWRNIGKAESFDNWKAIGAALSIGKAVALRATGVNRAWGRNYSKAFCEWTKANQFGTIPASVRSAAIELHENIDLITAWRSTLSEKQRASLVHPLSNVRRWKSVMGYGPEKCPQDLKRDAVAAWRRFMNCVKLLPLDQAKPLLQIARAELCR